MSERPRSPNATKFRKSVSQVSERAKTRNPQSDASYRQLLDVMRRRAQEYVQEIEAGDRLASRRRR